MSYCLGFMPQLTPTTDIRRQIGLTTVHLELCQPSEQLNSTVTVADHKISSQTALRNLFHRQCRVGQLHNAVCQLVPHQVSDHPILSVQPAHQTFAGKLNGLAGIDTALTIACSRVSKSAVAPFCDGLSPYNWLRLIGSCYPTDRASAELIGSRFNGQRPCQYSYGTRVLV